MALRRKAVAPQTEYAVLEERIQKLENQIKQLRQASTSTLQAENYERIGDPVPFQTVINPAGLHVPAVPESPMVYYHPGDDDTPTGVTPAGFKALVSNPSIEVAAFSSSTDMIAGFTTLEWGGSTFGQYRSPVVVEGEDLFSMGTTASPVGNIYIAKSGVYTLNFFYHSGVNDVNVTTTYEIQAKVVSGEVPDGVGSSPWDIGGTSHNAKWIARINPSVIAADLDANQFFRPEYSDWMILQPGSFSAGTAGPTEIEVYVQKEEDEAPVSSSQEIWRCFILRHGEVYDE